MYRRSVAFYICISMAKFLTFNVTVLFYPLLNSLLHKAAEDIHTRDSYDVEEVYETDGW